MTSGLLAAGYTLEGSFWKIALLGGIALLAERQAVRISASTEIAISVLPVLVAAVMYGPLAAIAVGGTAVLLDFGRPYARWAVWTSTRVLGGGVAGVTVALIRSGDDDFGRLVASVAAAALAYALVDSTLGATTLLIRRSGSLDDLVQLLNSVFFVTVPLYTPVLLAVIYGYRELSVAGTLLFVPPALAAQRLYRLYREEREAREALDTAYGRLEAANLSFATALVATLDARDRYTAGHSAAVAIYARDIAERLGLSDEEQKLAHLCGLVHDIGKIGLPAGLLEKPGALTLEERREMERHSEIGERILANVDDYKEIATIVRHHHERLDGQGYPDGLTDSDIPFVSKIIAVADAYNAMTSDRPYRDAMPSRVARIRLAQGVEGQFDTGVVAAFEAVLAGADESYRSGQRPDFKFSTQKAELVPLLEKVA
jgi:putative nucleotidyltransferase with HDIG domain